MIQLSYIVLEGAAFLLMFIGIAVGIIIGSCMKKDNPVISLKDIQDRSIAGNRAFVNELNNF